MSDAQNQFDSISALVGALSCDYDRLEELRDLKNTPRFVAGSNMPGYMPDSDPVEFDNFEDAKQYIIDEIKHAEDGAEESDAETLCALAGDVNLESDVFTTSCVAGYVYWVSQDGNMLDEDEAAELADLEEQANECNSDDEARERLHEDALSVEVRSSWAEPGSEMSADEYRIVVCTGGPHVEIRGDLNRGEPVSAGLYWMNWGNPLTEFACDSDVLLAYASCFFFGE